MLMCEQAAMNTYNRNVFSLFHNSFLPLGLEAYIIHLKGMDARLSRADLVESVLAAQAVLDTADSNEYLTALQVRELIDSHIMTIIQRYEEMESLDNTIPLILTVPKN